MSQDIRMQYTSVLKALLENVQDRLHAGEHIDGAKLQRILKKFPKPEGGVFAKDQILAAYRDLIKNSQMEKDESLSALLRMKPTRTVSGVAPVTVLTKPFPCPGKCIFCPNDIRMPKSYLSDEPGAQRAERNWFDPYLQTYNRLLALHSIGHSVAKVEIIVLGGTWSYYPQSYQIWFISECFRAMNEFGQVDSRDVVLKHYDQMQSKLEAAGDFAPSNEPLENEKNLSKKQLSGTNIGAGSSYNATVSQVYTAPERLGGFDAYQSATWDELELQQQTNETASQRCVGLVIETRPDNISQDEVRRIRRLGCTKAQIGLQSLQDSVLEKNKRGHTVAASRRAIALLRQAGFKIHAHWMANLYGSSVELDKKDYDTLFTDPDFHPDELKIYPCSLIESAQLMQYYKAGKWLPYTHDELLEVVAHVLENTPEYCRLTRVIRDIPSPDIVVGNKKTNFRQIAQQHLDAHGISGKDIRAREIKRAKFSPEHVQLKPISYKTSVSEEEFLQLVVDVAGEEKIVGFLRLSFPTVPGFIPELEGAAIIREVHVYGQVQQLGSRSKRPQHRGFGTRLLEEARVRAKQKGFKKLAVISAVGTRAYYQKRGFSQGELYQLSDI